MPSIFFLWHFYPHILPANAEIRRGPIRLPRLRRRAFSRRLNLLDMQIYGFTFLTISDVVSVTVLSKSAISFDGIGLSFVLDIMGDL